MVFLFPCLCHNRSCCAPCLVSSLTYSVSPACIPAFLLPCKCLSLRHPIPWLLNPRGLPAPAAWTPACGDARLGRVRPDSIAAGCPAQHSLHRHGRTPPQLLCGSRGTWSLLSGRHAPSQPPRHRPRGPVPFSGPASSRPNSNPPCTALHGECRRTKG